MRFLIRFPLFLLFLLISVSGTAIAGSCALVPRDSLSPESKKSQPHKPGIAAGCSALLPGLGQAYNHKYWKIPILYAGFGSLYYLIRLYDGKYQGYRQAYKFRIDGNLSTIDDYDPKYQPDPNRQFSEEELVILKDYYRRNRDLSYIVSAAVYLLNIVDATVDAHLFSFDTGDDLSLSLLPAIHVAQNGSLTAGLNLSLRF